eukprot:Cvel_22951.t1-p1 / transcript=Cvel_22951.t1 / gene=Cvel_22951 / organism=Chromera_velia_CCMP2878 / gene_product=Inositol hexakisphosphate and, putative / transcript_product=Inositol hexakisphosphate and, putative / location=Cvel_scaffold2311:15145-30706(+) / protein_length=1890 / sequence_SO=supercontig / SO=protein_coding / is_pseudo=false
MKRVESKRMNTHRRLIRLGVCAMANKVEGKPMKAIMKRLHAAGDFDIIYFPEKMILDDHIDDWPQVDCLIAFFSSGFPLEKCIEYKNKFDPIILNDLEMMKVLRDRLEVYKTLKSAGIPVPNFMVVNHEQVAQGKAQWEEGYDYICYNDVRLNKPFIEKPLNADDHNNWIYYPRNTGGGCKKLFRKVKDRASGFESEVWQVRKDGVYIYEEFLPTYGTDVKVYTVGELFAHAEARKAPSLDGKVNRTKDGKEVRYPVLLSSFEKSIAYKIVRTFRQFICGFDILRTKKETPVVCDVNGWSFVKGNDKYYHDCSHLLRLAFINRFCEKYRIAPRHISETLPPYSPDPDAAALDDEEGDRCSSASAASSALQQGDGYEGSGKGRKEKEFRWTPVHLTQWFFSKIREAVQKTFSEGTNDLSKLTTDGNEDDEELRVVAVVMRHGDRKPKQKLKFETDHPKLLEIFNNKNPRKEIKMKSPEELSVLLEVVSSIIEEKQAEREKEKEKEREIGGQSALPSPLPPDLPLSRGTSEAAEPPARPKEKDKGVAEDSGREEEGSTGGKKKKKEKDGSKEKEGGGKGKEKNAELIGLKRLRKILLQGDGFTGINRKIQLKPTAWEETHVSPSEATEPISLSPVLFPFPTVPPHAPSAPSAPIQMMPPPVGGPPPQTQQTTTDPPAALKGTPPRLTVSPLPSTQRTTSPPPESPAPVLAPAPLQQTLHVGQPVAPRSAPERCAASPVPSEIQSPGLEPAKPPSETAATAPPPPIPSSRICVSKVLVVAKWGGELTEVGRAQAQELGNRLRMTLYPGGETEGLLRLHSTCRHDFKIYTSDEGRCQVTSAAFTKGFLDLEGELTPILVQLVMRDGKAHALLDDSTPACERQLAKSLIDELLHQDVDFASDPEAMKRFCPSESATGLKDALEMIGNPLKALTQVKEALSSFLSALEDEAATLEPLAQRDADAHGFFEVVDEIRYRWQLIAKSFFNKKSQRFDTSKVPEIVDNIRFDLIHHHAHLGNALNTAFDVHRYVEPLGNFAQPSEYGVTSDQKVKIGCSVVHKLMRKLIRDLTFWRDDEEIATEAKGSAERDRETGASPQIGQQNEFSRRDAEGLPQHQRDGSGGQTGASAAYTSRVGGDPSAAGGSEFSPPRISPPGSDTQGQPPESPIQPKVTKTVLNSEELWAHQQRGKEEMEKIKKQKKEKKRHKDGVDRGDRGGMETADEGPLGMQPSGSVFLPPTSQTLGTVNPPVSPVDGPDIRRGDAPSLPLSGLPPLPPSGHQAVNAPGEVSTAPPEGGAQEKTGRSSTQRERPSSSSAEKAQEGGGVLSPTPSAVPPSGPLDAQEEGGEGAEGRQEAGQAGREREREPSDEEEAGEGEGENDHDDHHIVEYHEAPRLNEDQARALGIKSPWRMVRSRFYVTSASHLQSLLNVVLFGNESVGVPPLVARDAADKVFRITDLHYLSYMVFRLWERRKLPKDDPNRFRVEILFSTGAKDGVGQNIDLLQREALEKQEAIFHFTQMQQQQQQQQAPQGTPSLGPSAPPSANVSAPLIDSPLGVPAATGAKDGDSLKKGGGGGASPLPALLRPVNVPAGGLDSAASSQPSLGHVGTPDEHQQDKGVGQLPPAAAAALMAAGGAEAVPADADISLLLAGGGVNASFGRLKGAATGGFSPKSSFDNLRDMQGTSGQGGTGGGMEREGGDKDRPEIPLFNLVGKWGEGEGDDEELDGSDEEQMWQNEEDRERGENDGGKERDKTPTVQGGLSRDVSAGVSRKSSMQGSAGGVNLTRSATAGDLVACLRSSSMCGGGAGREVSSGKERDRERSDASPSRATERSVPVSTGGFFSQTGTGTSVTGGAGVGGKPPLAVDTSRRGSRVWTTAAGGPAVSVIGGGGVTGTGGG